MDAPLLTAVAILVCAVLLALACVDCLRNGPPVSIQGDATDEYIPSTEFRLVRPHLLTTSVTSDPLSPMARSSGPGSQRTRRSVTSTQSESNVSYENSQEGLERPQCFAEDYVVVLPEDQAAPTNRSAASTPSSGVLHEYINVPTDHRDYLDVIPPPSGETSSQSDEDDGEGEGNYVNQPSASA